MKRYTHHLATEDGADVYFDVCEDGRVDLDVEDGAGRYAVATLTEKELRWLHAVVTELLSDEHHVGGPVS